jgi:polysaccharide pyruvyl transferase WcaK-like protein
MSASYKTIGLLDHMGFGNMGDAAVQEAFITNIRRRLPSAHLIAFSLFPDDTQKRHNVVTFPIKWCYPALSVPSASSDDTVRVSRLRIFLKSIRPLHAIVKPLHDVLQEIAHLARSYRVVRSLDLLVISGGGQLCDLHGDLPYNVFKFCLLARLAAKPVFIVGVGADLLRSRSSRIFAKWSVRLAQFASFRSEESRQLIQSLGVNKETHVCPDPAYALDIPEYVADDGRQTLSPSESRALLGSLGVALELHTGSEQHSTRVDSVDQSSGPATISKRRVGLNPMGYCDPRRWPRKDAAVYRDHIDKLTAFSKWLLAHNFQVEIFSSDVLMDVFAIEDLKDRLVSSLSEQESANLVFRPIPTLKELLRQMASFDFVVTSKFHGIVFSHMMARPVIALSYLQKMEDLMRDMGNTDYCMDIEHFESWKLIERFQSMLNQEEHLRSELQRTSTQYADALRVDFDSLFGKETLSRLRLTETEAAGVVA